MKERILHELLLNLFLSTEELREWVYYNFKELHGEISGGSASLSSMVFSFVSLVVRRGYLDEELFNALKAKFPNKVSLIDQNKAAILCI